MAKKILLADDSLTIQKVVELTFSDSDYELFAVSNGQKALDRVHEYRPDLILADAVMPEKNGYEVCEAIKADPATAGIPVILLSGTFEPFDRERAERIGADAIVSKPFDSQQLLAQVDALLDRAPASRSYSPAAAEPFPVPQTTADVAMTHEAPPEPEGHGHGLGHGRDREHEAGDEGPFDTGFSAEDFTASIRKPSQRATVDPFEEEYGARGDVDSAIEAFEKSQAAGEKSQAAGAGAPAHEPAPAPEPREPSWLRDESERPAPAPSFFADREVSEKTEPLVMPVEPFDSGMASPPLHTSASMPSFDDVPPDQMPTLELPQLRFNAGGEQGFNRAFNRAREDDFTHAREDVETVSSVHAAISTPEPHEPHPVPEPPAPMRSGGAVEISEHEARDLFEVGSARPEPPQEPARHDPEPRPQPEAAPAQAAAPPEPVPGEIEMLAQRSSIPELTQMLSSVRSVDMTDEQIERLATRVVEKLSDRIVREIAWEVIPDMAEIVIKQRIKELESGIE